MEPGLVVTTSGNAEELERSVARHPINIVADNERGRSVLADDNAISSPLHVRRQESLIESP